LSGHLINHALGADSSVKVAPELQSFACFTRKNVLMVTLEASKKISGRTGRGWVSREAAGHM